MSLILAVDPGKMTGAALYDIATKTLLNAWECPNAEFIDWARDFLAASPPIIVRSERFVISGGTVRMGRTDENWSIECIGCLRAMCRWHGHDFDLQAAGDAKKMAPNPKLREIGWYIKGKGHATDAVRHIVLSTVKDLGIPPPWFT